VLRQIMIVDDEAPARERLERLIGDLNGWEVVASVSSGLEAVERAQRERPAVVLLDVRMPGMDGIEAARHLGALAVPPAVILTTAYDEYALEAFESKAVGYLLKPVRRARLLDALEHAGRLSDGLLRELGQGKLGLAPREHVAAKLMDELRLIPVREVLFFRAEQKYVTVHHRNGEDLIEDSLKRLAEEFGAGFCRIHRSVLVALAHIDTVENGADGYRIRLRGSSEILSVSRRQVAQLRARLRAGSKTKSGRQQRRN
jgi:two-component system response regulator AlgR